MDETALLIKLGEKIKATRIKMNMSQHELAMECNFEKASMSRIESGQVNPTVRTLNIISKALGIKIADLFIN